MTTTRQVMEPFVALAAEAAFRIAPENANDLAKRVGAAEWNLELIDGEAQFYALPIDKQISLSASGLASLWCVSLAAFHTMRVTSQFSASPESAHYDAVNLGQIWADRNLQQAIDFARRLFSSDEDWPDDVARPDSLAPLDTYDGRVNNIFLAALGFLVLHEVAHIHLGHDRLVGIDRRLRQEYEADQFAVEWSLAAATGLEREFRVLAIVVAEAWILLFETEKYGGVDHPPSITRFREAASHFDLATDSVALESAVYALKAIFDPTSEDMPLDQTAGQAFEWMSDRLVELFPR